MIMVGSDDNGRLFFSKGLVWVLGIGLPLFFTLVGVGVKTLTDSARIEMRVESLEERTETLRRWGPDTGDRYTAQNARTDWQLHNVEHAEIKALIVEEFAKVNLRLDRLER